MKAILGLLFLVFCVTRIFAQRPQSHKSFDKATTQFALGLYEEIAKSTDASKNIIFSPLSIFTAFGMLKAGAKGETLRQMNKILEWSDLVATDKSDSHSGLRRLLKQVFAPLELNNTIKVANKLWMQSAFCQTQCKRFVKVLEKNYNAALEELNFVLKPEAARNSINKWVEDQTNKKIKDLMPSGSITSMSRFVITNAIYFKGKWSKPFEKKFTRDSSFNAVSKSGDLKAKQVPTMFRNGQFFTSGLIPTAPYQLLELPYMGDELSMMIILPRDANQMKTIEKTERAYDEFNLMLQELYEFPKARLDVFLPKFKATSSLNLKDQLTKMGMRDVFNPSKADLSGITGYRGMYVSAAVHKAFISVDEEGTEAAAATGINIALSSLPFQFKVDKPFLYIIRHRKTGTILFMGRIVDPTL
eukprot:gene11124-12295_t